MRGKVSEVCTVIWVYQVIVFHFWGVIMLVGIRRRRHIDRTVSFHLDQSAVRWGLSLSSTVKAIVDSLEMPHKSSCAFKLHEASQIELAPAPQKIMDHVLLSSPLIGGRRRRDE